MNGTAGTAEEQILRTPGVEETARSQAIRNIESGKTHKATVDAPGVEAKLDQLIAAVMGHESQAVTSPPADGRDVRPDR